jgi:hypothetical protein
VNILNKPDPAAATELSVAPLEETADERAEKAEPRPSNADAALSIFGTKARKSSWTCSDEDFPSFSGLWEGLKRRLKLNVTVSTVTLPDVLVGIHVVSRGVLVGPGVIVGDDEGAGMPIVTPGNPTPIIDVGDAVGCGVSESEVDIVEEADSWTEVEARLGEMVDIWSGITGVLGSAADLGDS